jgi:uncharacterized protein (DUF1778 family)
MRYSPTKKPMVPIALRLPCALRELWHSAAAREEISQSDFLRRAIEERATRVLLAGKGKRTAEASGMNKKDAPA